MNVGTAAITEMVWTFVGLSGLGVVWWAHTDAVVDLASLRATTIRALILRDPYRAQAHEDAAIGAIVQERFSLAICSIVTIIGLFAMTQPAPNPDAPVSATGVALTIGLILIVTLIVVKSIHRRLVRHRVVDNLQRAHQETRDEAMERQDGGHVHAS